MNRIIFKLLLFVFSLHGVPLPAQDLTVLFTHDLHSMFLPHQVRNGNGATVRQGGYASLCTAIRQARARHPESILVDAGDFSSGSFFYTLFPTDGAELQLMALMGYDAVTLGNHDFDFGVDGLADALAAAKQARAAPPIVAANLKPVGAALAALKTAFDDYGVREYIVVERNGMRIGLFGLMGDDAMHDAPEAAPLAFENRFDAAKRMVRILRDDERVDVVVCLSHSGTAPVKKYSEDEQLAAATEGIDVIVSGHSHTLLPQPLRVRRTVIVSAGCYAEHLGVLTLHRPPAAGGLAPVDLQLIPVDSTLAADASVAERIHLFKNKLNAVYFGSSGRSMDDTVACNAFYLPAALENNESLLGNLIADAFARTVPPLLRHGATGTPTAAADVRPDSTFGSVLAVVPQGTIRNDLFTGPITEEQIFGVLSLGVGSDRKAGYPLVCTYLTGKELWDLCEVDASCGPLKPDARLSFAGLKYTYHPHRLFCNKVTEVWVTGADGKEVAPDERRLYPVVSSLYAAQMLGIVKSLTHGILSLEPKDAHARPVEDFLQQVVTTPEGGEWKEWEALSRYLHSFDDATIPAFYAAPEQRKTLDTHAGALFRRPNGFALLVYGTAIVLLAALAWAATFVVRKIRNAVRCRDTSHRLT
jgi:2',3'-cyclic-nucleotide 2'-phosphodiesterase (5'-nucleotidase family)